MTLTASYQINIQLILTLTPAKNLASKKSYTVRKFSGRGKGKSSKPCFQGAQFWVLHKDKIFPGRYLALPCERDGDDWLKIKINPPKETNLGVAQTLFGP